MNWLINIWNRIQGKGQIANPLARLVELNHFPKMDLKDKFCDCNYYYIFREGNCMQIMDDSEIDHDYHCLGHSDEHKHRMGFSFSPLTYNRIKAGFPWMDNQQVDSLVNRLLIRHSVFCNNAHEDLSLNEFKWYLMYYSPSEHPIPLLTIRKR
jgi:hypothetical protein